MASLAASITEPYDIIFIDADKISYPKYLKIITDLSQPATTGTRLLRPGGLIMADNILRRALIADASEANPASSWLEMNPLWKEGDMVGLKTFNEQLVANERYETFLMPMFDGVGMGRLKD